MDIFKATFIDVSEDNDRCVDWRFVFVKQNTLTELSMAFGFNVFPKLQKK